MLATAPLNTEEFFKVMVATPPMPKEFMMRFRLAIIDMMRREQAK